MKAVQKEISDEATHLVSLDRRQTTEAEPFAFVDLNSNLGTRRTWTGSRSSWVPQLCFKRIPDAERGLSALLLSKKQGIQLHVSVAPLYTESLN